MHEYALVHAMMRRVAEEARARHATAVQRTQVRIGRLSGVEADLFASAYDILRAGTLCAAAELIIARDESEWRCRVCDTMVPNDSELVCPDCRQPARLVRGDALVLERIELEVA